MDNPINWGDIATWFTGILTLGLFAIGAVQIHAERQHRKKAERELELRSKRDQAEHISCWISKKYPNHSAITISNQSRLPIYQAIIVIAQVSQEGGKRGRGPAHFYFSLDVVPPGIYHIPLVAFEYQGIPLRSGTEIAFSDSAGNNWVREVEGQLISINQAPHEYFSIALPLNCKYVISDADYQRSISDSNPLY